MTTAMAAGSVSTVQHREGLGLQDARTRLLTANVILQHQLRQQQQQQLLQPARREASLSSSPASSTSSSSRSSRSSALSATSPPFVPHAVHAVHSTATDTDTDSMRAEDLSQTLPSFGARTAAAKQLLSAAPGGPVFGHRSTSGHSGLDNSPLDSALCQKKKFKKVFCPFCKKNGERKETYTAHGLNERSPDGSIRVICPVLRSLRCEICGSTGDRAHTRTHCPMGMSLLPVATILKSTQRRCDGSKRSFL
ncbi:uncharacterized protein LOC117639673 [Thrips palmi]|uniref:Uncharacterized protein LOC117639673 n=1 Tax=Thrips palmi TaxID=161013 RepID=A0A6P8ZH90_THRPL|nr:uncharacterized protein LOC117639673 [Thrips palmi]